MQYAPANRCNYNSCCFQEYRNTMPACIRNKQPDCLAKAVIPSITVDTVDGLTNLANCFVHVTSNNTTYYVDDKHRPMITWAGDIITDVPSDVTTYAQFIEFINSYNLRNQHLYARNYDEDTNQEILIDVYFDDQGNKYATYGYSKVEEGGLI